MAMPFCSYIVMLNTISITMNDRGFPAQELFPVRNMAVFTECHFLSAYFKKQEDKTVLCKNCGTELKDGVKFCPSCGSKVVIPEPQAPAAAADKCPGCGNPVNPGQKFCPVCGTKIVQPQENPIPAPAEEKKEEPQELVCSCGTKLKSGAKFCPVCGNKVGEAPKPAEEKPAPVEEKPAEEKPAPVEEKPAEEKPAPVEEKPAPAEEKKEETQELVCSCGTKLKPGAKFCPVCGNKVGEAPKPAEEKPAPVEEKPAEEKPAPVEEKPAPAEEKQEETQELVCSCGTKLKPGAKFCPVCGNKAGEAPKADEKKQEEPKELVCSCGNKLKPDAKFCPVCGKKAGEISAAPSAAASSLADTAPIPAVTAGAATVAAPAAAKKPVDKKLLAIIGGAAAALIIIIVVIVIIVANATPKITLSDYMKVEFKGYNGYGRIDYAFDSDKFRNDWEGKLKYTSGNQSEIASLFDYYTDPTEMVLYSVKYSYNFDKTSDLKNGDKVKLTWDISESKKQNLERFVNCQIDISEKELSVEGLDEIGSFDPFDGFNITYTGYNGNGRPDYTSKYSLSYTFDKTEGLKNGDKIHVSVSSPYGDDLATYCVSNIGSVPSTTGKDFTVEGLKEMGTFDPFADITVEFEGVSPNGTAKIVNNSSNSLRYELDKEEGLKEGDKVTVTVSAPYGEDLDTYCSNEFEAKPSSDKKEYIVKGLGVYVVKIEEIDDTTLAALKKESEDTLKSQITGDGEHLEKLEYQGIILLNLKDNKESNGSYSASSNHDHMINLVYKVTVRCQNYDKKSVDYTYWTTCRFNDMTKLEDGTCKVDTNEVVVPSETVRPENAGYYYYGYENYTSLFAKVVTALLSDYTYETDINKSNPGQSSQASQPEASAEASKQESSAEASKQESSAEASKQESSVAESSKEESKAA